MSYRTEGDQAWIEWKDTKFRNTPAGEISRLAARALEKLLAERDRQIKRYIEKSLAVAIRDHDRKLRRWGWTRLVKSRVFTYEEIEKENWHWHLKDYEKDTEKLFRDLQKAGETADNMTFSLQTWRSLVSWSTPREEEK